MGNRDIRGASGGRLKRSVDIYRYILLPFAEPGQKELSKSIEICGENCPRRQHAQHHAQDHNGANAKQEGQTSQPTLVGTWHVYLCRMHIQS